MTSLHRLIAIVTIWVVAGGAAVSMFGVSFLGALGAPMLLLLTAIIFGAAAYATAALARG